MKFHTPSFLLGVGVAAAAMGARSRLRPVMVELSAFGLHVGRVARGVVERQRESLEDLWAEIEHRATLRDRRPKRARTEARPAPAFVNGSSAGSAR